MNSEFCTNIIDISHIQTRCDLKAAKEGGISAVLHKASEGKDWSDTLFSARVTEARKLELNVGAYHFGTNSAPGNKQADWFLSAVDAVGRKGLLLALDWETNERHINMTMTLENAIKFVSRIREMTGVFPLLYSGQDFLLGRVGDQVDPVLTSCPLWIASYNNSSPRIPSGWSDWSLWQYTNGTDGPEPRATRGFSSGIDRSAFRGTEEGLATWWATRIVTS